MAISQKLINGIDDNQYDPYQALAAAIVGQAVDDLRLQYKRRARAEERLQTLADLVELGCAAVYKGKTVSHKKLTWEKTMAERHLAKVLQDTDELEAFFYSNYFMLLSDLDGPALQESIAAEFDETGGAR